MKKYFSIAKRFFLNTIMSQLEYRFESLTFSVTSLLWMVLLIVSIELVFGQTSLVAGWTKAEVLLVAATQSLFVGLLWLQIIPSILIFTDLIKKGNFDFYLLKPINTRFLLSVNKTNVDNFLIVIASAYLVLKYFMELKIDLSLINFFGFFGTFFLGMIIFYNLFFLVITLTIWLVDMFSIHDLFSNFMDNAKYPVYIFQGVLRVIFIFIIPTAFISTFPVQFLLGRGNIEILLGALAIALITFFISQWFWNFALKHYSSASS